MQQHGRPLSLWCVTDKASIQAAMTTVHKSAATIKKVLMMSNTPQGARLLQESNLYRLSRRSLGIKCCRLCGSSVWRELVFGEMEREMERERERELCVCARVFAFYLNMYLPYLYIETSD